METHESMSQQMLQQTIRYKKLDSLVLLQFDVWHIFDPLKIRKTSRNI